MLRFSLTTGLHSAGHPPGSAARPTRAPTATGPLAARWSVWAGSACAATHTRGVGLGEGSGPPRLPRPLRHGAGPTAEPGLPSASGEAGCPPWHRRARHHVSSFGPWGRDGRPQVMQPCGGGGGLLSRRGEGSSSRPSCEPRGGLCGSPPRKAEPDVARSPQLTARRAGGLRGSPPSSDTTESQWGSRPVGGVRWGRWGTRGCPVPRAARPGGERAAPCPQGPPWGGWTAATGRAELRPRARRREHTALPSVGRYEGSGSGCSPPPGAAPGPGQLPALPALPAARRGQQSRARGGERLKKNKKKIRRRVRFSSWKPQSVHVLKAWNQFSAAAAFLFPPFLPPSPPPPTPQPSSAGLGPVGTWQRWEPRGPRGRRAPIGCSAAGASQPRDPPAV